MPVPAVDADKRGDAYKKVKPVDGIDEQGLVPDPRRGASPSRAR